MVGTGIVTTGRGMALNLDELIRKSEIPIGYQEGKSTKERPAYKPATDQKPKIRGFIPVHGEASAPVVEEEDLTIQSKTPVIATSFTEDGTARNLAEITGIRVKETDRIKHRVAKAQSEKDDVVSVVEEEVLGDLIKELKVPVAPKKSRKKTSA